MEESGQVSDKGSRWVRCGEVRRSKSGKGLVVSIEVGSVRYFFWADLAEVSSVITGSRGSAELRRREEL